MSRMTVMKCDQCGTRQEDQPPLATLRDAIDATNRAFEGWCSVAPQGISAIVDGKCVLTPSERHYCSRKCLLDAVASGGALRG